MFDYTKFKGKAQEKITAKIIDYNKKLLSIMCIAGNDGVCCVRVGAFGKR